jgi:prophage antirepressor-like protein
MADFTMPDLPERRSGTSGSESDDLGLTFYLGAAPIRCGADGDRVWFVLADLAVVLGYRDAANARRLVRPDQLGTHLVSTPHTPQKMITVTESGMYRLVMRSDRPEAEPFQDWVTSEVLPAIRRRGMYALPAVVKEMADALRASVVVIDAVLATRSAEIEAQQYADTYSPSEAERDAGIARTRGLVDARQLLLNVLARLPDELGADGAPVAIPVGALNLLRMHAELLGRFGKVLPAVAAALPAQWAPVDVWKAPPADR